MFGLRSAAFTQFVQADPREVGVLVTLWVATALLYPALRRNIGWFVDAVILHRPDYRSLRTVVARRLQTHDDVPPLLTDVCELLAPALSARGVGWREWQGSPRRRGHRRRRRRPRGGGLVDADGAAECRAPTGPFAATAVAAVAVVPTQRAAALRDHDCRGHRRSSIPVRRRGGARGHRRAGRRGASTPSASPTSATSVGCASRKSASSPPKPSCARLRAQVNPHFLFNALTTIGYLIQTAPPRALQTLMRLTSLLRAVLRSEGEFTTLGRELDVIESYLDIERARFEQRLHVTVDVPHRAPRSAGAAARAAADRRERGQARHRDLASRRRRAGQRQSGTVRRGTCAVVARGRGHRCGRHGRRARSRAASPASACEMSSADWPASTARPRRCPFARLPGRARRSRSGCRSNGRPRSSPSCRAWAVERAASRRRGRR